MGIYDRDYYRQERPLFSVRAPRSTVGILIAINVAVWILDYFTPVTDSIPLVGERHWLSDHLAVTGYTLIHPWMWWQFLTYGFAHSPFDVGHILWNMFALFIFGRDLERQYGRKEFTRVYLVAVVLGGLAWGIINQIKGGGDIIPMYGASGAVTAVVLLYALNFPYRTILLFFVLPVPAWALGALIVGYNVLGAVGLLSTETAGGSVAVSVHLAGAAFAYAYHRLRWNLGRLVEGRFSLPSFRRRPRLRIHHPDQENTPDLSEEVDRILAKIHREGEESLTRKERRTLETASRQYQRKRQQQ